MNCMWYEFKLTVGLPVLFLIITITFVAPECVPWTAGEMLIGAGVAGILHFIRFLYQNRHNYRGF